MSELLDTILSRSNMLEAYNQVKATKSIYLKSMDWGDAKP
ncbi:hypothetical protein JOC31_000714 [Streptococcus saliviloxodontae]|uniref:Uncharacterized protein n=1 Tax=Streptococcus saliviloxodontae TaxID=1349416 RepID=A0ABS2PLD6_9STRE|nr:hypothetical protein [Streptococcus saliviloxodontae]